MEQNVTLMKQLLEVFVNNVPLVVLLVKQEILIIVLHVKKENSWFLIKGVVKIAVKWAIIFLSKQTFV